MKKILILLFAIINICAVSAESKESICGDLSQIVYSQYAPEPKQGCLYAYSKGSLTLQVLQSTNDGILVTAKYPYYGGYYTNPKTIYIQTSKQFVDDQILKDDEIVKYMGIYEYFTAFGIKKRVYKFYRYGKYEIEKNVNTESLEKYGFITPKYKIEESWVITDKGLVQDMSVGTPRPPKEEWAINDSFYDKHSNKNLNNNISSKQHEPTEVAEYFKQLKNYEEKFKNIADSMPSEKNDKEFRKFLLSYWDTIENINEYSTDGIMLLDYNEANGTDNPTTWSLKAKKLVNYYKQNGVAVEFSEGFFYATVDKDYLKSFYKYLTPQYIKWLDFDRKIQTEIGKQDNCYRKLYEIVKEGTDYYKQ